MGWAIDMSYCRDLLQPCRISIFKRSGEENQWFSIFPTSFENVEPSPPAVTIYATVVYVAVISNLIGLAFSKEEISSDCLTSFENVKPSPPAITIDATVVIYDAVIFNPVGLAFS